MEEKGINSQKSKSMEKKSARKVKKKSKKHETEMLEMKQSNKNYSGNH